MVASITEYELSNTLTPAEVDQEWGQLDPIALAATAATASTVWSNEVIYPDEMNFSVDGVEVQFKGQEIIRLKEMLNAYIKETNPEDLL